MSNFAFLAAEFPAVHEAAVEAERELRSGSMATGSGTDLTRTDLTRTDQDGFDLVVPRCILPPRAIPGVCS
jgi:hypothetical protein